MGHWQWPMTRVTHTKMVTRLTHDLWPTDRFPSLRRQRSLCHSPSIITVHTIEIKLKRNWNKAKTKRPVVKRLICFSQSLSVYAVWAPNQRRGGAMTYTWRHRSQRLTVTTPNNTCSNYILELFYQTFRRVDQSAAGRVTMTTKF